MHSYSLTLICEKSLNTDVSRMCSHVAYRVAYRMHSSLCSRHAWHKERQLTMQDSHAEPPTMPNYERPQDQFACTLAQRGVPMDGTAQNRMDAIPVQICLQIFHYVCSHNVETVSTCTACHPSWHGWCCATCNSIVPHLWTPKQHFRDWPQDYQDARAGRASRFHAWQHDFLESTRRNGRRCPKACPCCTSGTVKLPCLNGYILEIKCPTCEELRRCSAVSRGWLHFQVVAVGVQCPQEEKEDQLLYLERIITVTQERAMKTLRYFKSVIGDKLTGVRTRIEFKDDHDYWWTVPTQVSAEILHQLRLNAMSFRASPQVTEFPYTSLLLSRQRCRYSVDTTNMTHKNLDTGNIHEIRFRCSTFLLTKSGWSVRRTEKSNSVFETNGARIEVRYDNHWQSIPSESAAEIFESMYSGRTPLPYRNRHSGRCAVDMTNMTHQNLDTQKTRQIRLCVGPFQLMKSVWSARPAYEDGYCFLSKGNLITPFLREDEPDESDDEIWERLADDEPVERETDDECVERTTMWTYRMKLLWQSLT